MNTNYPSFLNNTPKPTIRQRLFNGRKMMVWEGKVKISQIKGWVENPRIELFKKIIQDKVGPRQLTQDEIYELMKNNDEIRLKELRDDIIKNGLREPLTLSHNGKLLDGNRRFFAIKFALENMNLDDPNRQDFELVDSYVLDENATPEDEQNVLIEENFSPSLKIEWPDYVKAIKVIELQQQGYTPDEIARKFNWTKSKIRDTIKISEIINNFESFAIEPINPTDESGSGLGLTEQEAQVVAAKNYQFFNEAQKSFYHQLTTEIEFALQFFRWIYEKKFSSFPEVRIAYRAWKEPEAKAALLKNEPAAAKEAKAILDYNDRVVKNKDEIIGKIENFVKFLKNMKAEEIASIPENTRKDLEGALNLVTNMSQAVAQ